MNKGLILGLGVLTIFFASSCSKKGSQVGLNDNSAALTIVNLINESNGVYTNFTPNANGKLSPDTLKWYYNAGWVGSENFQEFSLVAGTQTVGIVSAGDTAFGAEEWGGTFNFANGSIHSLYLTGPDTTHIDTLLTTDNMPNYPIGDSVIGVRFINLAQQTDPVLVDVQGASDTLVSSMSYKTVSGFFTIPATGENPISQTYTFEFRDALTGVVLSTYSYSGFFWFKSVTVVFWGSGPLANWNSTLVYDF